MKITVKLVGALAKFAPAGESGGESVLDVESDVTPRRLLELLALPESQPYLVSVNQEVVPSANLDSRPLAEGDRVSIMPPLKGG